MINIRKPKPGVKKCLRPGQFIFKGEKRYLVDPCGRLVDAGKRGDEKPKCELPPR